jgi:hypothetical protein
MEKSSPVDLYYQLGNSLVQAIPVVYDTRFTQNFNTLGQGQQSLFIPPSNGINKVMIVLEYSVAELAALAAVPGAYCLPRGWGYQALQTLSFRISGSQQYFASAAQVLASNMRKCRTKTQRDAILSLGGNECKTAADFSRPQRAYIPMSFFTAPSVDGLDCPIASDILGSQIQLTCIVNPASVFFLSNPLYNSPLVLPSAAVPTSFTNAFWTVEQLSMMDRGMSLASRPKPEVNLDTETYVQAIRSFDQQELTATINADSTVQTVNVNGFMSGQVRGLQVWLTPAAPINDAAAAGPAPDANGVVGQSAIWYAPDSVRCIFAGQIYADYQAGSSAAWNLIDGTSPNIVDSSYLYGVAAVAPATTGTLASQGTGSQWVLLPFSQPSHNDFEADLMVSGLRITNGSVQLQLVAPYLATAPATPANFWTVHVVPILNAAVAYSRGSATLLIG